MFYVQKIAACDDTGPATLAEPFCTLQHALDVVNPGDTIAAANSSFAPATMTRSGTPDAPITITSIGSLVSRGPAPITIVDTASPTQAAMTFNGVHDVNVNQMYAYGNQTQPGFAFINSHAISVTGSRSSAGGPTGSSIAAVAIDGASSGISIYRSLLNDSEAGGVSIGSGASDIMLSTNEFNVHTYGILANGVSGLTVTSNTIQSQCGNGASVAGAADVTVENNIFTAISCQGSTPAVGLVVAADSVSAVHADYNAMDSRFAGPDYSWGGSLYVTPAAFTAATGQGAHDVNVPGGMVERSVAVDSADANAPGELNVDYSNQTRRDDPLVANTGSGSASYFDRGATEMQDAITFPAPPTTFPAGAVPYQYVVPAPTSSWGEPLTLTTNYGDGSPATVTSGASPLHTYTTPGLYYPQAIAVDADGRTYGVDLVAFAATVTAPTVSLSAALQQPSTTSYTDGSLLFSVSSPDQFEANREVVVTFGDGTSSLPNSTVFHAYAKPGYYTAKLTSTDVLGRISTATTVVAAGAGFASRAPIRDYDTRQVHHQIAAHGTLQLSAAQLNGAGATAVVINTTVMNATKAGNLIVYPGGTTRPTTSVESFAVKQTVVAQSTDLIGTNGYVEFYNSSAGPIDLVVDTYGSHAFGTGLSSYTPLGPIRALDTRTGGKPVAAGGTTVVNVAAAGVPVDAQSVVLNVTTTDTHSTGYTSAYAPGGTSSLSVSNWVKGQTVSNLVTVPVANGQVNLKNYGTGTVDFVADVVGYYSIRTTPAQTVYVGSAPARIMDTRTGAGTGHIAKLAPGQTIKLTIAGKSGIPLAGTIAAQLSVTATNAKTAGSLTIYADGTSRPTASTLAFAASASVANASTAALGSDGAIDIYNGGTGAVDVVVDLEGTYFVYPAS